MAKKKTAKKNKEQQDLLRPPIVTVMGHVDHGKTTLLDAIREANTRGKETGGMTQSIGAYQIKVKNKQGEKLITFIDTPGHEAFTAMRARGASVTDIVVLVVAADDGVKPQTIEAIDHAKAAGVPIIVAVNKIDLPGANTDKIREQLAKQELIAEDWGGQTIFVEVSAKDKKNLEELLEMILLVAEMEELKVEDNAPFSANVIESHLDSKRGVVISIIVKSGFLKRGDQVWVGDISGKVRSMVDDRRVNLFEAGPSTPVEIIGLKDLPPVGSVVTKEKQVIDTSETEESESENLKSSSLDELFEAEDQCPENELNILVKAESQGCLEAVVQSLNKIEQEKTKINIIHKGTGMINESDVLLAKVSCAKIISFRVKPSSEVLNLAYRENIAIMDFDVIYKLIEEVEKILKGEKDSKQDKILGQAKVLAVFDGSKNHKIAGVKVTEGNIKKGSKVKILRGEEIVGEGKVKIIKHLKEYLDLLKKGMEGGITLDSDFEYEKEDIIESYS